MASQTTSDQAKKTPGDFKFGKLIGEGSYSQVFLTQEISTQKEYAMKVLEKRHIVREKKTQYVKREKEVLLRLNHPFFIKLHFTFQDEDRLYFGLSYAQRGELLDYIKKLGCFDEMCTRFYVAEIVEALEYLHGLHIIHRDLKPENILLNDDMHVQITDFGSAKIVEDELATSPELSEQSEKSGRRRSFVGTAQYVSPEVLKTTTAYYSSDLWALGCIIYQLLSGQHPFWGSHEYQIFQKIMKLEYEFPSGFNSTAQDLVTKLLVLDHKGRLGCEEMGGYTPLKQHPFLKAAAWGALHTTKPPELLPFLPDVPDRPQTDDLWGETGLDLNPGRNASHPKKTGLVFAAQEAGLDDKNLLRLDGITLGPNGNESKKNDWLREEERRVRLDAQEKNNEYHRFVEKQLILKQGLMDKRKGLFARRRMFLLTEGPRLFYVDPSNMVLKGEIPWSKELRPEAKNFKILFVHTPNRIYYLEDPQGNALKWSKEIERVWTHYYSEH